jgi:tetratricopeptide (TPR) repeat protein
VICACVTITALVLATTFGSTNDQQKLQQFLEAFSGEIETPPPTPTVRLAAREYIVGRQLASEEKHGPAVHHFKRAAELDDKASAPWFGMAVSLSKMGRAEGSIIAWRGVLQRNPNHGDALLVVGLDAARQGQFADAISFLSRRWLQKDDNPVEALLRDSALLTMFRKLNHNEVAVELKKEFQSTFDQAVTVLIQGNDRAAWLGVLQQLIDFSAPNIAAQVAAAGAPHVEQKVLGSLLTVLPILEHASLGDGSLTLKVYSDISRQQLLPLTPKWNEPVSLAEAFSVAAQSISMHGSTNVAISFYEKSIELNPLDSLTVNNLAWMKLQRDGATEEVVALCGQAIEMEPDAPFVLDTVAWMYAIQGNSEKAIPLFIQALQESNQPSPETYDHLGDAYWMHGKKENAIRAWQTAADILNAKETKQDNLEGLSYMAYSIWGITVMTPEAMYDLELGELVRKLKLKLKAIEDSNYSSVDAIVNGE